MSEIIEIRVRRFYTSDESECDITPTATFITDSVKTVSLIGEMVGKVSESLAKQIGVYFPIKDVRPMTKKEVEEYRSDEEVS